jgi:hypothetical protein
MTQTGGGWRLLVVDTLHLIVVAIVRLGFDGRQASVVGDHRPSRGLSVADASRPGLDGVGCDEGDGARRGGERRRAKQSALPRVLEFRLLQILVVVCTTANVG